MSLFCNKDHHCSECLLSQFLGQDTDVHETLEEFEQVFGQYTIDKELSKEWEENLIKAENEINKQNERCNNGDSTYWEELNEFAELGKEEFEKEKTGLIPEDGNASNRGYAMGLIPIPETLSRKLSM